MKQIIIADLHYKSLYLTRCAWWMYIIEVQNPENQILNLLQIYMRILIVNGLKRGGGTEVQTQREFNLLQENGHDVYLLNFDPKIDNNEAGHSLNIQYKVNGLLRIYYRNHLKKDFYYKVRAAINSIQPDAIHINNLQDNAFTVLEACKGYPVVKTVRDPGLICPKATCLLPNHNICAGYKNNNCTSCIGFQFNYQIAALQSNRLRKQYREVVSQFICPSQYLAKTCSKNEIPTICINNPFDFAIVKKKHPSYSKKFLYYGCVSKDKGVCNLLDAFILFRNKHNEMSLLIAGKLGDISKKKLESYKEKGILYIGVLTQREIMELYKDINCVVVPSIWLENYPNTVLEALACKTMVIGSNRGGISEMIGKNEFLFDPMNITDIENKMEAIYSLSQEKYKTLVEDNYSKVCSNNKLDDYYNRLMEIFEEVINR